MRNEIYLIIKAAATFLTLGHFNSAIMVSKFPQIPTIITMMVNVAANVNRGLGNLKKENCENYYVFYYFELV